MPMQKLKPIVLRDCRSKMQREKESDTETCPSMCTTCHCVRGTMYTLSRSWRSRQTGICDEAADDEKVRVAGK